ncbi:MAG TPA: S41 family peptidase [Acidobacteriaceae bacterium]|nr:S41 family peptidase [Acidobacteriaceae bacterium]
MSEKIYALLLRLYPARFRAQYGEEALRLLRDRLRDEPGFLARVRLWLDLLLDLGVSVPREHHAQRAEVTPLRLESGLFRVLDDRPPRPGAFLFGSALALTGVLGFFFLLNHAGVRHPALPAQSQPSATSASASATLTGPAPAVQGDNATIRVSSGAPATPSQTAQQDSTAPLHLSVTTAPIDPAERHRVIAAAADALRRYYFDRPLAENAANTILAAEKSGVDDKIASGNALAAALNRQLYAATRDMHLAVIYSADPIRSDPQPPSPEAMARYRQTLLDQHCLIDKAERLPHSIGYLKFDGFPDPAICGSQFRSVMKSLSGSRALIIDLTGNRGGQPAMVVFLAGYFFDHQQPWYNPKEPGSSSLAAASGTRFAHTPLYILTSPLTISAAEHFSYNLKMLHRATLVGQVTAGAAHAGAFHRIDDHFGMAIPEFRIVNPYSDRDWAVIGVQPDVFVPANDALTTARRLAVSRLASASAH